MSEKLLIIFVKNILLGKVKTRLAKTIGKPAAFEVYKHLVEITERETSRMKSCDVHIYFSDVIIDDKWPNQKKFIQQGIDLGERMQNAFKNGFELGYQNIIGIGSDLPDLNAEIINHGFEKLNENDTVFGPAEDGGYYLIGMNKLLRFVFENKQWSTNDLLFVTKNELQEANYSIAELTTLNDIDTLDDLKSSTISKYFKKYY